MDVRREKRITEAEEFLDDAVDLHGGRMGTRLVLMKLYHAMLYALFALFGIEDIGPLSHADIIEKFEREFIGKGKFRMEFLDGLRHAYSATHSCGCSRAFEPKDAEIEKLFPLAEAFVRDVREFLAGFKEN
jgi:uncharacterized protein (UPF0332 family)